MEWKQILLIAGGATGAAALLYYLLKDEAEETSAVEDALQGKGGKKASPGIITKEDVIQLLNEIVTTQEQTKARMKSISDELAATDRRPDFREAYEKMKEASPADPLEERGLSMTDFDQLLQQNQSDPQVMELLAKIMAPSNPTTTSSNNDDISVGKIVEIHKYMLAELQACVKEFQALPDKAAFDLKTVALTSQAVLAARVTAKFGFTSEDIEGAIMKKHKDLGMNPSFLQIHQQIQETMEKFMSAP